MLGAFFGPPYRDWWLSYAKDPKVMSPYHNHWLVRQSAAKVFAEGLYEIQHVLIRPEEPIKVDGTYPLLGDHSRRGVGKIDPRFPGTHARLCGSIQFLQVSKAISSKDTRWLSGSRHSAAITRNPITMLLRIFASGLSAVFSSALVGWRILPSSVRFSAYRKLHQLGRLVYGHEHHGVQRLPFGLYLKYHGESAELRNEFNALRTVGQHTSIPIPSALDVVSAPRDGSGSSGAGYLLTTRVQGLPLSRCLHVLSDSDCDGIATQMNDHVSQLRCITRSKLLGPDSAISNTLGEACRDPRISGARPVGPFADEAAFSKLLRFPDHPARRGHKIFFTHADLNPRNILIDKVNLPDGSSGWRITGIVDWEGAGHYPEYWEYTKSVFEGFRWPRRYSNLIHKAFAEFGDYSGELDVERRSWESGDGV
ncbi:hypothetical protein B0T14DRAFT_418779 [Immersiella caudata]|uniref:Aminoglycoside phosphotransferase domain-containing protein n=1 Tax=Immersiella caudata TaxID=314043 RepID=A0AA40CCX5_9PEZI|nr:hypothetical protein B0T14DRAFT_418779 [Immersiella caudata]